MSREDDYRIGYGRPPREAQFKKGQSGNPSGRPKGARNISSVLERALSERVPVTVQGRRKHITKLEAAVIQIVNQAAGGDQKATKLILSLSQQIEAQDRAALSVVVAPLGQAELDKQILLSLRQRMQSAAGEGSDGA